MLGVAKCKVFKIPKIGSFVQNGYIFCPVIYLPFPNWQPWAPALSGLQNNTDDLKMPTTCMLEFSDLHFDILWYSFLHNATCVIFCELNCNQTFSVANYYNPDMTPDYFVCHRGCWINALSYCATQVFLVVFNRNHMNIIWNYWNWY